MRYSKYKLKGLPTPKEIIVKNLADYIKLFSSNQLDGYILRGEPTNYCSIISSALRGKKYPFIQMKNDFKREVFHRLSPDERNYFLAFSQHHGIPTNLIDFTRAPLVALYFACQPAYPNERSYDLERGFIHLLKDDLIDVTFILSESEDEDILDLFIRNKETVFLELYKQFVIFEKTRPEKFYYYFKQLSDDWQYYFVDMQPRTPKKSKFPPNNNDYKNKLEYEYVRQNKDKIALIESRFGEADLTVLEYTLFLQAFLTKTLEYREGVWWLNCIPNFMYNPILSFDRGRNQKGLFIYQAYMSFDDGIYNTHILSLQRVWPEIIIVIENKQTILRELDLIDINEKFIYGDYDNIARYIKKKYP